MPNARLAYVVDGNHSKCLLESPHGYNSLSRYVRKQYLLSRRIRPLPPAFNPEKIAVAVHIRRGNILQQEQLRSRAQSSEHFLHILTLLQEVFPSNSLDILILTNENTSDICALANRVNARIANSKNDIQDFHSLATSDIILTSNSGFSYLATLINRSSLKIVPSNFWHEWPQDSIVFDGSDNAISLLREKSQTWELKHCMTKILRSTLRKNIWDIRPAVVAPLNSDFRDKNYDNIATSIKMLKTPADSISSTRGMRPVSVQSRKLYGCVINAKDRRIELSTNLRDVNQVISLPSAFLEFSCYQYEDLLMYKTIGALLKVEFHESLMGRLILVPPDFPISLSDFLSFNFHESISIESLSTDFVYCDNLIALRVNL
jgi:hypothetical protein